MAHLVLTKFASLMVVSMLVIMLGVNAVLASSEEDGQSNGEGPVLELGERDLEPLSSYHTLKITIHRMQGVDSIDFLGSPDWYYAVGISEDGITWQGQVSARPIVDEAWDVIVDAEHFFTCDSDIIQIFIALVDYDSLDADDVADISSTPGGGGSIFGDLTNASSYPSHSIFKATYYFSTHTLLGDGYVPDGPWLKTSGDYDGSTGIDQDDANLWFQVEEVVKYPIEVYIHKIGAVDEIDIGSEAEWYYGVFVSIDSMNWESYYSPVPLDYNEDDLMVDRSHVFHMDGPLIYVAIILFDYDSGGTTDDLADISSEVGGGQDNFPGGSVPSYAYFLCVFDWTSNTLQSGFDSYVEDNNWYYKTSGEFDGSVGIDENDAELWFRIFSMPPKILDWSPKGTNVNDVSPIGITFGARMDQVAVESAFSIVPQIAGQFRWNNDSSSFFFIPDSPFDCLGSYSVTLTTAAADLNGLHIGATLSWTFQVESNGRPVAVAGGDQSTEMFRLVTLDASESYDFTGELVSYEWDFGDGITTSGVRVQHSYFRADDFIVILTVTDNYGLSHSDSITIHVEKGNFVPQNLVYDYAFEWPFFNENFTTTLDMSMSTGIDQLVDLSILGIFNLGSIDAEVFQRDFELTTTATGLTDDNGDSWSSISLEWHDTSREYLRSSNGFSIRQDRETYMELNGQKSDGTSVKAWIELYSMDIVEPISIQLKDTPQSPQTMDLWHFTMYKQSEYYEENGNIQLKAYGSTQMYLPFQRRHIIQPMGSKLMIIGDETVKAYGIRHTYEHWNFEVDYDRSFLSPYYDIITYGNLLLDKGWIETTQWFADKQQTILLSELSFRMDDNGVGSPDYSSKEFIELATLSNLRDRIDLVQTDTTDKFTTDYETTARIYEPWAHARLRLGGNKTHEVILGFDLVYDVILEHKGYVVFNHHLSGEELDRTIQSTLVSSYDEYTLYLQPHFDLSMESWNRQTGELHEVYFYLELPVPTLEDVDGDGNYISMFGHKLYLWDNPAEIHHYVGSNIAGKIQTISGLSVTLAKIDLLALIGQLSSSICSPCGLFLRLASWFVGLYINFNLNVQAEFYYLIGTYGETSKIFQTGEDADLHWFGFQSPPGETATKSHELSLSANLGETIETSVFRLVKSHVDAAVQGSINFETVLFPGTIFEITLLDVPIMEGETLEGSANTYSFTDTYLFHEYTGEDLTPPFSEVHDLPLYSASTFVINADSSDQLSGVKDVKLYYRLDYGSWTEYGILSNDVITFNTPSDGYYEFYTIATDNWGNIEQAPSIPDASTYVDTTAPNVVAPPSVQTEDPEPTVEWEGSDDTTGINHYEISVDYGPFEDIGNKTNHTLRNLSEGTHQMTIRAYDNSGNYGDTVVEVSLESSGQNDGQGDSASVISFEVVAILVALIAGIVIVLLAAYSNRRKRVK